MVRSLLIVSVAFALAQAAAVQSAQAQTLRTYRHAEFGTAASVPATWRESRHGPHEGVQFISPDGSARIAVWSVVDDGRRLNEYMRTIAREGDVKVTYDRRRRRWFVLSGFRGDLIFYTKVLRACGRLHHVALEYPAAKKRAFDRLVTRVSHSLRARC